MEERQIEAFVASPPERDELCVQLFKRNGGALNFGLLPREMLCALMQMS